MRLYGVVAGSVVVAGFILQAAVGARGADAAPAASGPASPAARQAKQEYDAAVKRAEDALAAARAAYLEKLDAALKVAMQAGDLDEANRIDALRKAARAAPVNAVAAPAGANAAANAAPANASTRKPGWVVGRIADERGRPVAGAKFEVVAFGTTILGGQRTEFRLEVDEQGRFEQELPDGLYAVNAHVTKEFEGGRFRLQLHPDDNKHDKTKLPSKPGIVKDFTWRMTGQRPDYDPQFAFAYYGPAVEVNDARYLSDDNEHLKAKFGNDAKVVVTLTPRGTLIDGGKGEPVTVTGTLADLGTTRGIKKFDVPLASYRCTAKVVTPDGREHPARVSTEFQKPGQPEVEGRFEQPGVYDSVKPIRLFVGE